MKIKSRKRFALLTLACSVLGISYSHADTLKPFTTDGCSLFPNGTIKDNSKWVRCCIEHDIAYWKGGEKSERTQADNDLKMCVEEIGEKSISVVMHLGVTIGGSPVFPTWYRWGYGWDYNRGYKPLSEEENKQVKARLLELRNLIDNAITQSSTEDSKNIDAN